MTLRVDGAKGEAIERIVETVRNKMAGNKATAAEARLRAKAVETETRLREEADVLREHEKDDGPT